MGLFIFTCLNCRKFFRDFLSEKKKQQRFFSRRCLHAAMGDRASSGFPQMPAVIADAQWRFSRRLHLNTAARRRGCVSMEIRTEPMKRTSSTDKGETAMSRFIPAAVVLGFLLHVPASSQTIWAVHDGLRLERDDLTNANKASNCVWDGSKIRIFGARNEVIAFQVIVQAGSQAITSLTAALPRLDQRNGQAAIVYKAPAADPTDYVDRPIHLFSLNYMNVTQETKAGWIIGSSGKPADPLGWKPEQLVPENARAGRGGFPLGVAANNNQALWFEIYTRKDLPAGMYDGTVTVTMDGVVNNIPLEMELFDFVLPDTNSMNEMIYFESGQLSTYQGSSSLLPAYHRFAHRNRVEFVNGYSLSAVQSNVGRFNGNNYTTAQKYEGPGAQTGERMVPRTFYGTSSSWASQSIWPEANAFVDYLRQNIPRHITFLYMTDEPSTSDFPAIIDIADNVHANPGSGSALKIFVTHAYDAGLAGAIDIWCVQPGDFIPSRVQSERAAGRDFWWYNGGRPDGPAFDISCPATDARVGAWASCKHGAVTHFYWHVNHWRHNSQWGGTGSRDQDIWANPITFNNGSSYANGDGVLVYPGTEVLHTDQDRGIAGPISSIRMANLRRGLQDHLYLTLAKEAGKQTVVDQQIARIVPRVFSEATTTLGFSEDGNVFEDARYKLAQAIAPSTPARADAGRRGAQLLPAGSGGGEALFELRGARIPHATVNKRISLLVVGGTDRLRRNAARH